MARRLRSFFFDNKNGKLFTGINYTLKDIETQVEGTEAIDGTKVSDFARSAIQTGDQPFLDNDTSFLTAAATDNRINAVVDSVIDSAPGALDTLNELAAALGDDANFSTTVTNSIATKWTQNNTKISNWDTAYGWGNHASSGYLTGNQSITLSGDLTGSGTTTINAQIAANAVGITELNVTDGTNGQVLTTDGSGNLSFTTAGSDQTASEILTAIKTVDGSGSGLDADLLDGNQATAFATAAQGTLADSALQSSDIGVSVQGYSSVLANTTASFTTADETKLDGIEAGATADQTASEILTAIKTVDGAGSGLDADTLDGQQGSYYTNYADTAVANLVASAPSTLDTLNELAAALGDDPNFATTVTNSIATKAPLASPTFTGTVTIPTLDVTGDVEVTGKLSSIGNFAVGTTPGNNYQAMVYSNSGDEQLYLVQDGSGGTPLRIDNSGGSYGVWLNQYGDGTALYIDSASTDSQGIFGRFTSLTTAAAMYVYSSSNSTSARSTIDFQQTSSFATNANVLKLTQASSADALFIDMNGNGNAIYIDGGDVQINNGDIIVTGTVDGRDIAADGTKLDGIESGATADQTAAEILTAIKTVDGSGSGLDADLLDGVQATGFIRTATADQTIDGGTNSILRIKCDDAGYALLTVGQSTNGSQGTGAIELTQDGSYGGGISYNGDASPTFASGETADYVTFYRLNSGTRSEVFSYAYNSDNVTFNGNIAVAGTVDGRDVAADGTKLDGIEAGATADQTASEILTAIKTVDGSGSGLDADLLDGQQGSYYQPASTAITNSATQANNIHIRNTSPTIYLRDSDGIPSMIHQNSNLFYILRGNAADDASWTAYSSATASGWPMQINLTNSAPSVAFGPQNITANGYTVWHSGNDGSGSGLDADTVDGFGTSTTRNAANSIPVRDANGYLQLGWINTTSGATTSTINKIYASNDDYIRYVTPATLISQLSLVTSSSSPTLTSLGVGTAASGTTGEIRATNNVTAYYSDERLKNFEGAIPDALNKVNALTGYYFTENETAKSLGYNNPNRQVGLCAQEVEKVLPEIVTEAPISDEYKTVYYDKVVPLLIEAIKELSAKVDELSAKVDIK